MALFQGLLLLIFGFGLLIMVYRSLTTGWLPCGPKGFKGRVELDRHRQPFGYWLMFAMYGAGGLWCLVTALSVLSGQIEPLPLQ